MKYSTQILLFIVFVVSGMVGYYTYQIYMDEQDTVQSNIVFSINTSAIDKVKNPIEFKSVDEITKDNFLKIVDRRQNASLVMANAMNLMGFPSWNDVLVEAFKYYMGWIGKGAKMQKLSAGIVKDLSAYYDAEKCDLTKVTFGHAPRLAKKLNSPHLGITDAYKIYFGDESYVKRLAGTSKITKMKDNDIYWIAHELTHCEQYAGDREKYAVIWFNQVFEVIRGSAKDVLWELYQSLLKGVMTGDFSDLTKVLSPENLAKYDDKMDLEQEALDRGNQIVKDLRDKESLKASATMIKPGVIKAPVVEVR